MSRSRLVLMIAICVLWGTIPATVRADGAADNDPVQVRRIPPAGIEVSVADRAELQRGVDDLQAALAKLAQTKEPRLRGLVPDVAIFHKAVRDALAHQEFFAPEEIAKARELLKEGNARAEQLAAGQSPWTTARGLVVRGYVSRIDGSVQPYGLVVPESYTSNTGHRYRLDIWLHGRNEKLSEVNFLDERRRSAGQFTPPDTIVLHPYGRYCNAFKFAGEVDVLEALEDVQRRYRIDDDRIAMRGFSMGGAGCWQFAVHYADRWAAAAPGAGFAETADFLKVFQKESLQPTWYEQKLWRLYDCPPYAANLLQCPTVAYSGELDTQKQAADIMARALAQPEIGVTLRHIIGPGTKHSYHPQAKAEIDAAVDNILRDGRHANPRHVHFSTPTLKYNRMNWVTIDGLGEHWIPAWVRGEVGATGVVLSTNNVTDLTLSWPSGRSPFAPNERPSVTIDGNYIAADAFVTQSDRSLTCSLYRERDAWRAGPRPEPKFTVEGTDTGGVVFRPTTPGGLPLRKRHGLQGPIDDAFMDSFVFVRPTGSARHPAIAAWVKAEFDRAVAQWRSQFRGAAQVVDDTAVDDKMVAESNLVLWGDPGSNALLGKIAMQLPIRWSADTINVGDRQFSATDHAVVLIHPNPLNPRRYVVLNSGFTFREYDYLSNARQNPRLPDWAIVDVRTAPGPRWPGKIAAADFFDETWRLKPAGSR